MKNGIVVPCYNEAKRLDFTAFAEFVRANKDYSICFVNDGSTDQTLEMLTIACANTEGMLVCNQPQNKGKAEAVRAGINFFLEQANIETIGFMDADLSTSFEEYQNLVDEMQKSRGSVKMAFGSRVKNKENNIKRTPFRSLMSAIVGIMIRSIIRLPIKDTQCGAKVFLPETARFCFKNSFITRWLFDVELFIRIKNRYSENGIMDRLKEIPLKKWVHVDGSKISFNDSIRIPSQLLKITNKYYLQPQVNASFRSLSLVLMSLFQLVKP